SKSFRLPSTTHHAIPPGMCRPGPTCGRGAPTFRIRLGQLIQLPRLSLRTRRWVHPSLRTCRLSAHSSTFSVADRASAVAGRATSCTCVGHALSMSHSTYSGMVDGEEILGESFQSKATRRG